MAQNISLIEYANLKSSNINNIVQFALSKGITIPNTPEYVLDDSILKQIDPIFHHNMKYKRTVGATTNATNNLNVLGQNLLKKKTCPETTIAVVQFFDDRVNKFGKVLTNALGITNDDKERVYQNSQFGTPLLFLSA